MHAWALVDYEARPHLALYLYKGEGTVELSLFHDFGTARDRDEMALMVSHLNEARGLGAAGVKAFIALYTKHQVRLSCSGLITHIHP
jgi:hypothetical protein